MIDPTVQAKLEAAGLMRITIKRFLDDFEDIGVDLEPVWKRKYDKRIKELKKAAEAWSNMNA